MWVRNAVAVMLLVTVICPIVLYTDTIGSSFKPSSSRNEFIDEVATFSSSGIDSLHLNLLPQETPTTLKEPAGLVFTETTSTGVDAVSELKEYKSTRVLSAADDDGQAQQDNTIREVTEGGHKGDSGDLEEMSDGAVDGEERDQAAQAAKSMQSSSEDGDAVTKDVESKIDDQPVKNSGADDKKDPARSGNKQTEQMAVPDALVRQLKDQLILAKVYLSLSATKNNPHFTRELRLRIKEVRRVIGTATKDSELPRNSNEKLKAMEQTLAKGKQMQDDCAAIVRKLRAMLHWTEDQLRVHKKQTLFLTQLTAKTLPKGLHCLPLRLTTEYYSLSSSDQHFPNQERLEDPKLYHYALFSDNVLAASVVINSTISNAKHPSNHVFHIVTDKLNYAAMRMWFLVHPPGKATVQVQNIGEFTWLNSSYSPVLKQLASQSMIDYYFRAQRANLDSTLKYRNPKYLSILNHLRFYLPEIFPKLDKVLFLDDDIVVQKDLSGLWSVDLKGNVNGAVETCGESFHRFHRYLNFSNPIISKNFDPRACGWAYGMNIFDLKEWKRQNITGVYHTWQNLNHDRQLWNLGTLPPGLITFWKRTFPLDRKWHVLGLGYNPNVNQREIERAAVIHYNGNLKPWLEIGIPKYRNYWAKYVDYDQVHLRDCNINP
ncbi:hypothetical protein MLD38_039184 [Melastoma candidum]|uniref:Uncharacterized protein n=1 Tax=Melastoma candidum TaxID=119954 RepID=A0ACB9L1B3_9MYRT|nr:hypothetical protein MLD38_039184 [Melastoma candidum]